MQAPVVVMSMASPTLQMQLRTNTSDRRGEWREAVWTKSTDLEYHSRKDVSTSRRGAESTRLT